MIPIQPKQRGGWRSAVVGAILVGLGIFLLSSVTENTNVVPHSSSLISMVEDGHAQLHHGIQSIKDEKFSVEIDMYDLLEHASVEKWILENGLTKQSPRQELLEYLPERIIVRGDRKLMRGNIGKDAAEGYVAFSITKMNSTQEEVTAYVSAFTIVVNVEGSIAAISATMLKLGRRNHMTAMKFYPSDPRYMIVALDIDSSESGPYYLWNWDGTGEKEYIPMLNGTDSMNCHDMQMQHNSSDRMWSIGTKKVSGNPPEKYDVLVELYDEYGKAVKSVDVYDTGCESLNHLQMIDEDKTAIGSEKVKNAIINVDMVNGHVRWVVGGPNGTFKLIDEDGLHHKAGTSLWHGQHNAEYFGHDEYLLFDDQTEWTQTSTADSETKVSNTSRLLIVKVDEENERAKIIWAYPLMYHTNHFGDMDMIATGNILGAGWVTQDLPGGLHPGMETQVLEVVRETKETAWEVIVIGNQTQDIKEPDRLVLMRSWGVYSAERMYAAPLVYNTQCHESSDDGKKIVEVSFTTQNRFKQSNKYPGFYEILATKDGVESALTSGDFAFEPYFRPAQISFSFSVYSSHSQGICNGIKLNVTNMWGDQTMKEF